MKKIIFIGIFVICFISLILFCGISLQISGFCCLTSKFYDDPYQAFVAENDIEIENVMGVVSVEKNNALYVFQSENEEIVVSSMRVKNGKYFCDGNIQIYPDRESGDYTEQEGISFSVQDLYGNNGFVSGKYSVAVVFDESAIPTNAKNYCFIDKNDKEIYIVVEVSGNTSTTTQGDGSMC